MKLSSLTRVVFVAAMVSSLVVLASGSTAMADTFGSGANQFSIDFVPISGATNPTSGYGIVNHDYRMGTYAISNDQWNKFTDSLGVPVTGANGGYGSGFYNWGTGTTSVPTNNISWYEAAQFVNYLNTSTGHQAAYEFTGNQGTSNYTFATWSATEATGGTNLYRNKDAYYFLPSEDEWVKAAYWNGTSLQTYATKNGSDPAQSNDSGTGWNYWTPIYAPPGPWAVSSGSQELNGTYNMMGNVWHWLESPYNDPAIYGYGASTPRGLRGGSFGPDSGYLASYSRSLSSPTDAHPNIGFRVASSLSCLRHSPGMASEVVASTWHQIGQTMLFLTEWMQPQILQ